MPKATYQTIGSASSVRNFLSQVLEKSGKPDDKWVFRGQSNAIWDPSPQIDREEFHTFRSKYKWTRDRHERWLLEEFKKGARPHALLPPQDQWEWLALAQHHGLATRLLDWTSNPLGALRFACEQPDAVGDSVIWCYHHNGLLATQAADPFAIAKITAYWPPHVTQRITVQGGCFTAHPAVPPTASVKWPGDLLRVIVPRGDRQRMRQELTQLGINRATLFPDLDGIAIATNRLASSVSSSAPKLVHARPRR
ncbi:MAG: FRG domain-containing protein [Acidobacteriota bacterium]